MAGIYIIQGGGFKVSGNLTLNALEVMVYNGDGPTAGADQIVVSGNATVNWTPPTSGPWKGISMFQQRDVDDIKIELSGNGGTNIAGTVYARDAEIELSGDGGTNFLGGAFVASSMQISGNGTLNIGDDGSSGGGESSVFLVK